MLMTALLAVATAWCLLAGVLSLPLQALVCLSVGVALPILGRHEHSGNVLHIDVLAQKSRLGAINPALKVWGCLALLAICVVSDCILVGVVLTILTALLTVVLGKLPLREYLSLLALPASFLLLSVLTLLFDFMPDPAGVLNLPFFGGFLSVTPTAQIASLRILCRSMGAVSCLYLLSLSTPLSELIGVLRRAHVPAVVAELMYLIYRYLFILMELHRSMRDAADSRLGYHNFAAGLRTTGAIYAALLARSFRRAGVCFDAMESRCYDGELRFLEAAKPVTVLHGAVAGMLVLFISTLAVVGSVL